MARVDKVPADLLGLSATPGVEGVLEARHCALNGAFDCRALRSALELSSQAVMLPDGMQSGARVEH